MLNGIGFAQVNTHGGEAMTRAWMLFQRRAALCALVLCHALWACSSPRHDTSTQAAAAPPVAGAQSATIAAAGAAASDDVSSIESDCSAKLCVATAPKLSDYCELEHARCPMDSRAARALACQNRYAQERMAFVSTCGGNSMRIGHEHGAIDYHYDAHDVLQAVTTSVRSRNATCETDVVLYGDAHCQAGETLRVTCP